MNPIILGLTIFLWVLGLFFVAWAFWGDDSKFDTECSFAAAVIVGIMALIVTSIAAADWTERHPLPNSIVYTTNTVTTTVHSRQLPQPAEKP